MLALNIFLFIHSSLLFWSKNMQVYAEVKFQKYCALISGVSLTYYSIKDRSIDSYLIESKLIHLPQKMLCPLQQNSRQGRYDLNASILFLWDRVLEALKGGRVDVKEQLIEQAPLASQHLESHPQKELPLVGKNKVDIKMKL